MHIFAWMSGVGGIKSMLDFVLVSEEDRRPLDVNVFRDAEVEKGLRGLR